MRDISGWVGVMYSATEWIMRLSVINLLWFIINVPISIVIYSTYSANFSEGFLLYLLPLVFLIPTLLIPSTIALFATAREWVMGKEQKSLVKAYFTHIRSTYKQSFLSGIVLTVIWLIWFIDFLYFKNENDLFTVLFGLIGILLVVFTINFFMLSVHFQMKRKELLTNAFHLTFGKPVLSLFILLIYVLLCILSITKFLFLIPLFIGSLSAYLSFFAFYRLTVKMESKVEVTKCD